MTEVRGFCRTDAFLFGRGLQEVGPKRLYKKLFVPLLQLAEFCRIFQFTILRNFMNQQNQRFVRHFGAATEMPVFLQCNFG